MQTGATEESESYSNDTVKHRVLPEITKLGKIKVSDNEGMTNSLTDHDTESFWESGKSKKWIQIDFEEGTEVHTSSSS